MSLLDRIAGLAEQGGRALDPASLLARAFAPLFDHIPIAPQWERAVRAAAERGAVVHVIRNVSLVDYLAIDHLTRKIGLPRVGFANELGSFVNAPGDFRFAALLGAVEPPSTRLRRALEAGRSAVLFMKGAPSVLDRAGTATARGRSEGDALLRTLIDLAREGGTEITLLPETLVWTQRPERLRFSVVDTVFGPADFPGDARAALQFLLNYRNAAVRAGEPLLLRDVLALEAASDEVRARRLTYALLRRVERERRAIVGPAQKPADRVREEVLRSPKLQAILRDLAGPEEASRALLTEKARGMLRELEATPEPQTLKGLELVLDSLVEQLYAGVDVDKEGLERVRAAARKGSLVILPSHKSHVDYVLLSYVLRKNALQMPAIAAGDNLAFFPLGPILRRAGAFFIRRSFKGDRLYTAVVDAYIRRLLRDGYAIEFFLEGGRSRTGKLLAPKLGLLNMVVDSALGLDNRTVSFVPVSIGYERMMEESTYARELSGGVKNPEDAAALLKIGSVLREKYGRANVQFGEILELGDLRARLGLPSGTDAITPAKRRGLVTRLAHRVMSEINRVTAVTPGSLVAMALLCHGGRGIAHLELVDHCARMTALVRRIGARTAPSLTRSNGEMRPQAIRDAAVVYVRGGTLRQHVPGDTLTGKARRRAKIYTGDDVIYSVPPEQRMILDLSKNIIVHLFVDRALVSVALLQAGSQVSPGLAHPGPVATRAELGNRVQSLSRLFKLEFMYRADASFERIFDDVLADMVALGELSMQGEEIVFGRGHSGLGGRGWIAFYAAVVRNFVEGYRVAARAARVLTKGPLPVKELVARALRVGEQMFLGGEIERSEAVSQPVIENAYAAFTEQGYLQKSEGKLALAESFATEQAAATIETKIASYLLRRSGESAW